MIRKLTAAIAAIALLGTAAAAKPDVAYRLDEGQNLNAFVREGPVAAHLLLRSGREPRILVAFPAGNSGVGMWFQPLARDARWRLEQAPAPANTARGLYGIVTIASIDAPRLVPRQAVLSSVRFLRDYQAVGKVPSEIAVEPEVRGDQLRYRRQRLDGAPGYELVLRVLDGRLVNGAIVAGASGRIRLAITARTGDAPLTPLPAEQLLNANAATDPAARTALSFLSYREKFLAGSWRFNTYFGRDTLMSVRLLMPALQPAAVEAGINSVLARLSPGGEVAHEEGIGEFAVLRNRRLGSTGDAPELDYAMVDDDYMLGPVVADYLVGSGRTRARNWLAANVASAAQPGRRATVGALLVRNLRFVIDRASPFAAAPSVAALIAIKPGRMSGEWRDSDEGLGRGTRAYDVNAALVPAALAAADRLLRDGLLEPYLGPGDRAVFARAGAMARIWRDRAPPLFRVEIPATIAARAVAAYSATMAVPPGPAMDALAGPIVFHALSIDAKGTPVPIVNSDEGFALLFGAPSPQDLNTYITAIMRPFPAGLMTDIGLLVANAAFADPAAQARFTPGAYHGAVVWSWQQALLAAGLERQLARTDLPAAVRDNLVAAQARLWTAIGAARAVQSSELWSWAYRDGHYVVVPFGAGKADVDESNAAQLWSTVYLAVRPPSRLQKSR